MSYEIIELEDNFFNPREDQDNLGIMYCLHKKYNLGDDFNIDNSECYNWKDEKDQIKKEHSPVVIEPLFLYDHGGLTMSNKSFSCRFDSGQVGFIFTTKRKVKDFLGIKRITKDSLKKIKKRLNEEIKIYDNYLQS